MDIRKLKRKPFDVEAVQVTEENINEVAAWCGGEVQVDESYVSGVVASRKSYVKVKVRFPLNDRQTQAHIGDWVLSSKSGYKVYTDGALGHSFEPDEDTPVELRATAEPVEDSRSRNIFLEESGSDTFSTVSDKDSISGKQ